MTQRAVQLFLSKVIRDFSFQPHNWAVRQTIGTRRLAQFAAKHLCWQGRQIMGMHYGVIAARLSWNTLRREIEERRVPFIDRGQIEDMSEFSIDSVEDGFVLAGGEHRRAAYLIDTTSLSMNSDLIAEIARSTSSLVVGCGAETVSGSFWLTVADGPMIRRQYWQCYMELSQPLSEGAPFSCEAAHSLDDIDGNGMFAVLDELSFDFDGWLRQRGNFLLSHPIDVPFPEDGPLMTRVNDHRAKFKLEPQNRPPTQLVGRISGVPSRQRRDWFSWLWGLVFRKQ